MNDEPRHFMARSAGFPAQDPEVAFAAAKQRATELRSEGRFFGAGHTMSTAVNAAWGNPTLMAEAQEAAIADYQRAIADNGPCSIEALAALHKLSFEYLRTSRYFGTDRSVAQRKSRELSEELAQRMLTCFENSAEADGFLVRGVQLSTDLLGEWSVSVPEYEVPLGVEFFGARLTINVPSAFTLFVMLGDYRGAKAIIDRKSEAFTSPGLSGWKAVTMAFLDPVRAADWFDKAADKFASDTPVTGSPEEQLAELAKRGGSWSGANQHLWAKYFRSRARLVQAISASTSAMVRQLVKESATLLNGTESGIVDAAVSRFRILVQVLDKLLSDPVSFNKSQALNQFEFESRVFGEFDSDPQAIAFIERAAAAFEGFESDPATEITRSNMALAIEALGRIPLVGADVAGALSTELGRSAFQVSLGEVRTWMHRTLESIKDEAKLRKILLRLIQASRPLYSQIRHGPIEFGKDLAVLVDVQGHSVLRLYQVKIGDIDKRKWRESRSELEELLEVPLSAFQLPSSPESKEGFLVANGHASPYVEPAMEAWFGDRKKEGRPVEFIHLDKLVTWISEQRLMNEFRAALDELGIEDVTGRKP